MLFFIIIIPNHFISNYRTVLFSTYKFYFRFSSPSHQREEERGDARCSTSSWSSTTTAPPGNAPSLFSHLPAHLEPFSFFSFSFLFLASSSSSPCQVRAPARAPVRAPPLARARGGRGRGGRAVPALCPRCQSDGPGAAAAPAPAPPPPVPVPPPLRAGPAGRPRSSGRGERRRRLRLSR